MKKNITLIAALLVVLSILTAFAGCGKKDKSDTSTTATVENTSAQTASLGFTASVGAKSIAIYKDDNLFQTLKYPEDTAHEFSLEYAKEHIEFVDLNFDENLDICLATNVKDNDVYYYCWLFDGKTGEFVYSEELSALTSISVDAENKQIISVKHSDSEESTYTAYTWQDGKLVENKQYKADDTDIPASITQAVSENTLGTKVNESTTSRPSSSVDTSTPAVTKKPSASTTNKTGGTTKKPSSSTTTKVTSGGVKIETEDPNDIWY